MNATQDNPLLVHVTNIPTPYRIPFCNALHEALAERRWSLHVLYCAEREPGRHWEVKFDDMQYPWTLLSGVSPAVGGARAHFNPGIVSALRRLRPASLLIAGSWNMPTALLAASRLVSGAAFRIFWSEAHAEAVKNASGPISWIRRRCLRAYDAFAVPNEASADYLEEQLGHRPPILSLPNTVDDDFYREARSRNRRGVRRDLGIEPESLLFVCVAQLIRRKGVLELARATRHLESQSGRRCEVAFVGDGPLHEQIEAVGGDEGVRIRLTGHQNADQVRDWLTAADAFILPTKWDPNPLTVVEAAFAGVPLLVSGKAGNVRELVHEGESGMVIGSIEDRAIAEVMARFCRLSEEERRRLGAGASKIAEGEFRRRDVTRNFVDAVLAAQVQR